MATRGVDDERVFRDTWDYRRFLAALGAVVGRYGWCCHAYCLMGTHYHLLLTTPQPNLAAGVQRLNGGYAQDFNGRHERRGHLFGGRYAARVVERDEHLLETARYLALNPVRAGLCTRPDDWRWSSHRAAIGAAATPRFLSLGDLLARFGRDVSSARERYRAFVDNAP